MAYESSALVKQKGQVILLFEFPAYYRFLLIFRGNCPSARATAASFPYHKTMSLLTLTQEARSRQEARSDDTFGSITLQTAVGHYSEPYRGFSGTLKDNILVISTSLHG